MTFSPSYRRILNNLGYYDYQHGLIVRHLNQESGWTGHQLRCRNFILKAIEFYKPEKVTVLGSGWLLELPLAEMIERVKDVRLVDIVHPPEVIGQAGSIRGVELVSEDLSGGLIDEVWRKLKGFYFLKKQPFPGNIIIPEYNSESDPGLVISLNLLTQIEVLPVKYIRKKCNVKEDELLKFRAEVQEKHLSFLKKHKAVFITDVTEVFTDSAGNVTEVQSALIDLPEGISREEWTWDFDLRGSDYYSKRSVFKVAAILL